MAQDCVGVVKENIGLSACNKLPQLPRGMFTTPEDFVIPAATIASGEAAILTYLQDAMVDDYEDRIYFWPLFKSIEIVNEEAQYEETPLADMAVRDGKYRYRAFMKENICFHKNAYTHRANGGRVIILDNENQLIGKEKTNGDFAGLLMSMLNTEKLVLNDGSVSTKTPVYVVLANNKELDKTGAILTLDNVDDLIRLIDVTITVISATTTVITFTVTATCDGTSITGLVAGDFNLTDDDDGASHAVGVLAYNSTTKRYTLTGTAFEASKLNLDAPADLSIKAYESTGAVQVTPA